MRNNINNLLNPKSIAVVGVSKDVTKLGAIIYNNIIDSGYEGELYAVNPKYEELFDKRCYPSVGAIDGDVEIVIFVIPAKFIAEALKEAAEQKGIKGAVIISAGFKEIGEEGKKKEEEIIEIASKYGVRILGPNCLGFINTSIGLNASFATSSPPAGDIFFSSQSGAFCTAALDIAQKKNMGFAQFVSYGNKADVSEIDLIEYALESDDVKVVGSYIEEITDGQELYNMIRKKQNKPVILLTPGKTEKAKLAISSHTGSLAGSAEVRNQALKQCGAMLVENMNTMFNLLMAFSWSPPLKGKRIAVVTNAGGPGIIAADKIITEGLELAELTSSTQDKIKASLPKAASVVNPIDVIGDALAERYAAPIGILGEDPNVDGILIILTPQLITQIEETAKLIINESRVLKKPIFAAFLGGKYVRSGVERLYDHNVPVFDYVEEAIEVMAHMYKYYSFEREASHLNLSIENVNVSDNTRDEVEKIVTEEPQPLPEKLVVKLAEEFEIDVPRQMVSNNIEDVVNFCQDKYPIVMKATTADIIHKTDEKSLYLNLKTEDQVRKAFNELQITIARLKDKMVDEKNLADILIQEHIVGGEEIFVGVNRDGTSEVYSNPDDRGFGHMVVFGKGGIYTEVYKDLASRLLPLSRQGIEEIVDATKVSKVLKGARSSGTLAMDKVYDLIDKIQSMVISYPEIVSMDLNPGIVTDDRAVVVDLKVFVQK
ncbi:hypothetical protein GF362_00785 [Candidatus Dojkabacteria bacterium]|nr:hypothetical protein [Candidatus Dojkabacteria bacterium]